MRRRIKNNLHITVEGVDLTKASNLEFYMRQGPLFRQYVPEVLSESEMLVTIPLEDTTSLELTKVSLQLAFTNENGEPLATDPSIIPVDDLLKEVGYDPA